jgi:hypothetical protein
MNFIALGCFIFGMVCFSLASFFAGAYLGIRRGVGDMLLANDAAYQKRLEAETKAHEDRLTAETDAVRERLAIARNPAPPDPAQHEASKPFVVPNNSNTPA